MLTFIEIKDGCYYYYAYGNILCSIALLEKGVKKPFIYGSVILKTFHNIQPFWSYDFGFINHDKSY